MAESYTRTDSNNSLSCSLKEESPRLLQDCDSHNLPLHVKLAQEAAYEPLTENTEQTTTSTDVLLTVIYSLMLECGFVPAQYGVLAVPSRGYNRMNIQQFSKPPKQWLDQGCNLLRFSLALSRIRFFA
ncbi:uncharacterized protein LOC113375237 [Ctenocephalides felis]|uniref:uncharacterized protein LOC113375237 n=1 Tax=Ctenocephalides felis TaxID=7515 RepID=UPI000E6E12BC|nr:uncharacterized protein LOC113375237 [Ctenocephalides felis]